MHRLPYGFSENGQFAAKTVQNSVFLSRDPHILDRLYVMVPYMSFYEFSKILNFRSKSKGVSLRFERISLVCIKTDRNSIFLSRDPHILDRLYIVVPYMSFYMFSKSSNFRSKCIAPTVLVKIGSLRQKLTETSYFLVVTSIFQTGYT
jgi:hypothetical protein